MRQFSRLIRRIAAFSSITLLCLQPSQLMVSAQTTSGTLIGQVLDKDRKGLPDVKVAIVNELNGNGRAVLTNQDGIYKMYFLAPGSYTITASSEGYADGAVKGFVIPLNVTTPLYPPEITLKPISAAASGPAAVAQTVSGTELARTITTTDATRRGNFNQDQLEGLPLGGATDMRTFDQLAFLLPGVAPPPYTPGVRGPGVGFGIGTAGEFSVNGMRARSNNFTVDGSDNNDPDVGVRRQGFVALVPQSIESINEFEISTLLWDTENGRNVGSQVNAVSRDGGNKYHGQAYGFFTDSRLNARNFFDYTDGPISKKDPFTRAQTGFVIGGPVGSDRTQFFSSFEHLAIHNSLEQHFAAPIQSDMRFQNLSRFDVLKPFPNADFNTAFSTDLGATPLGLNIMSLYPAPNYAGGPYGANTVTRQLPADGRGDIFSMKVEHQFGGRNTLSARYNFTDDHRFLPAVNRAIDSALDAATRTQDLSLILDSQLGAGFFSNARFSYGRTRLGFGNVPGSPLTFASQSDSAVNINGQPQRIQSATFDIGELLIEPFSPVGINTTTFPQSRTNNTFQYADTISRTVGSHSIKFGADIRRIQLNSAQDRNFRPDVIYGGAVLHTGTLDLMNPLSFIPGTTGILSGVQLADLGLPSSIFQTITLGTPDSTIALRFTEYNFFYNDNWRPSRKLTINYGLRYEYNTVPVDANHRIEDALTLKNLPTPGGSAADSSVRTAAFDSAVNAYKQILGGRTEIYEPDRNNFAPYVGFAFDPWSDGKTVIRGGYGIFYDTILGAVVSQSRNVFPNQIPINVDPSFIGFDVFKLNNPVNFQLPVGSRVIPLIAPGTLNQFGGAASDFAAVIGQVFLSNRNGGGLAFTLPDKNLRTPYAQDWHLSVERQIAGDFSVAASYVGSKGTKLTRLTTPNFGPNVTPGVLLATTAIHTPPGFTLTPTVLGDCPHFASPRTCTPLSRPDPSLGAFEVFEDSAASNYHALQVEVKKRFSHRYSFTAAYTWSHAIDDVSDLFPIAGAPILPQDSFNLRAERASANFDIRQRFTASGIWDLPFFSESTGSVAKVFAGWKLTSIFQANTGQPFTLLVPFDSNFDGNLTDRPSTTSGLVFTSGHSRQRVAMAAGSQLSSFVVIGQAGAVGRNTVRGDGLINLDLALLKDFRITESQRLGFRAEFFNALNRANFGLPIPTLTAPGFGTAVDTATPARIIQFALKYSF